MDWRKRWREEKKMRIEERRKEKNGWRMPPKYHRLVSGARATTDGNMMYTNVSLCTSFFHRL